MYGHLAMNGDRVYTLSRWIDLGSITTYSELKTIIRKRKFLLHPDRNGNPEEFSQFCSASKNFEDSWWESVSDSDFSKRWSRYVELVSNLDLARLHTLDWLGSLEDDVFSHW